MKILLFKFLVNMLSFKIATRNNIMQAFGIIGTLGLDDIPITNAWLWPMGHHNVNISSPMNQR